MMDSVTTATRAGRLRRLLFSFLNGLAAAAIAAVMTSFINIWLYPDLPLNFDAAAFWQRFISWSLLGGVLSGLAAYSAEGWKGISLSALGMALVLLGISFQQSPGAPKVVLVAFAGLLLPFMAMCIPLAWLFFWLAGRFEKTQQLTGLPRARVLLVNGIIVFALGIVPGWFAKFNSTAENGVRVLHQALQAAPSNPDKAFEKVEGFAERAGQAYTLSQVDSAYSTVGVDVTAHYADGYRMVCTVVLYPNSGPRISPCVGQLP